MSWGRFSFTPQQGSTWTRLFPTHKPAFPNVVVIDEDDDGDVVILEGAAAGVSSSAPGPGSQARKWNQSSGNVINIDDDEDEKDGTRGDKAGPSMSRASGSPATMTPGRGSPGNTYGLYSMYDSSESDLTEGWDSDIDGGSSDCEILDDTGTARKTWETAASRKKPVHECKNAGVNTSRSKDDHDQSSVPNVKECSMVGSEKASKGVQSPHLDENSASANRIFSGISSMNRKGGSPPISVSTPEKVDEKISEDVYSQKDQSPPNYNTNIYSAQDSGPATGKDLLQDPEELGRFASVIGEREKHKESAEYKRAAEEEWASRQQQLQIQAEEAKKLRKRKKAEAQRLLDMEKRQKQRLQEVRESQRKNEEAIQLKEQYQGVVRKELEDLERRHWNMTSILHALGISVDGGEAKAFKQALLKFHPDRVSRNDIYQQVKAEETFKFISRLKEKLPRLT